jgi:uncharacterized membrane protein YoaK (UPF0700 family)
MNAVPPPLAGQLTAAGLGFAAGFADAYSYLRWHAFAANQTGNTVIFAISLVAGPRPALVPLTLIVSFTIGAFFGRLIVNRFSPSFGLVLEALVLALSGLTGMFGHKVIAFAMGMQTVLVLSFAGVSANTSFISGDYSKLGAALSDLVSARVRPADKWRAISVLVPLLIAYALGALISAYCRMLPYEIAFVVPIILAIAYAAHRKLLA